MATFPTDLETARKAKLEPLTMAYYMDVTIARPGGNLLNRRSEGEV